MPGDVVYALDFDGVICDSAGESTISAIRAAATLWGGTALKAAADVDDGLPWLLRALRKVRPAVETGYENVLMARALCEAGEKDADNLADQILDNWADLRASYCEEWKVDREMLLECFGNTRDKWIENDVESWVGANHLFPGVADAINFSSTDVYILTTKQTRFCELILHRYGVDKIPADRIFGYGSGSKIATLKKIVSLPKSKGCTVAFVEDRYETLEETSLSMLGQPVQLFLASWGYNTEKRREEARKHPFISVIDLQTFVTKFQ